MAEFFFSARLKAKGLLKALGVKDFKAEEVDEVLELVMKMWETHGFTHGFPRKISYKWIEMVGFPHHTLSLQQANRGLFETTGGSF